MSNAYFQFQQFTVFHDRCGMKVGTDGVLLGAWVRVHGVHRVLDVGTGSGLISLMLAQRSEAQIDGVDVDREACLQAQENVARSPWPHRIHIAHQPVQVWKLDTSGTYDLVVSNPPYFSQSLPASTMARNLARHEDTLTSDTLLVSALHHLSPQGRLAVIYPTQQALRFLQQATLAGLCCERVLQVQPKTDKPVHRILMEFSRVHAVCETQTLIIQQQERHSYTPEYASLTRNFYLRFRHDS